ncbi:uncharacterized protein LOC126686428 [Mercurialis annua]|uniref:uncharacterized protein LOC126686428 n=1 Tax=Mercurialis annua TaxID=3986 RepID=UPI00216076EC|nr:uncharacterized protein LOC126686428 [Mercurialis annua]
MVFHLITQQRQNSNSQSKQNESLKFTDKTSSIMASSLKSHHQPLHNFSLPDLKWSINQTTGAATNHHPHRLRKSPHGETAVKTDNSDQKSKIFIRIKTKNTSSVNCVDNDDVDDDDHRHNDGGGDTEDQTSSPAAVGVEEVEETLTKTWNLRPRKPMTYNPPLGLLKAGSQEIKTQEPGRAELTRSLRNGNSESRAAATATAMAAGDKKDKEKKKVKFSIPLTKEEIEEDVYALTGLKPARRPKKRAKHVQKQLDCLFPGLWLASVTPEDYRVPDAPPKG